MVRVDHVLTTDAGSGEGHGAGHRHDEHDAVPGGRETLDVAEVHDHAAVPVRARHGLDGLKDAGDGAGGRVGGGEVVVVADDDVVRGQVDVDHFASLAQWAYS